MDPVNATGLLDKVAEQGALAAFMLLTILALSWAVKMLYSRNVEQGKENVTALIDSTTAINNNTAALSLLTRQIERLENAK